MERPWVFVARFLVQAGLVSALWFFPLRLCLKDIFLIDFEIWGHVNGLTVTALILWLVEDAIWRRHQVYARWGFREPVMRPVLRYLRTFLAIGLLVLGWAGAIHAHLHTGTADDWRYWASLGVLVSTSVAALGWMLSSYRSQQAASIVDTEAVIRDILQDAYNVKVKRLSMMIYDTLLPWQKRHSNAFADRALPLEMLDLSLDEFYRKLGHPGTNNLDIDTLILHHGPCSRVIYEYLNTLERIALGVRSGRLDFSYTYEALFEVIEGGYARWRLVLEAEFKDHVVDVPGQKYRSATEKCVYENFYWLALKVFEKRYGGQDAELEERMNGMIIDLNRKMF